MEAAQSELEKYVDDVKKWKLPCDFNVKRTEGLTLLSTYEKNMSLVANYIHTLYPWGGEGVV